VWELYRLLEILMGEKKKNITADFNMDVSTIIIQIHLKNVLDRLEVSKFSHLLCLNLQTQRMVSHLD